MKITERKVYDEVIEEVAYDTEKVEIWVKTCYNKTFKKVIIYKDFFCIKDKKKGKHYLVDTLGDLEDITSVTNSFRHLAEEKAIESEESLLIVESKIYDKLKLKTK